MLHRFMDTMISALKLRGAGLTPHFGAAHQMAHAEVRRQCELARQVDKSTPAAYEPTPLSASVCRSWAFCAPSHVEPIASYRFGCLSPLFCVALRRLNSRAVEAAVYASLSFSLSTSLSSHSAGLETLFSFEQRSLGNILRWSRVMELYLFRSVLVDSLRHGYLDFVKTHGVQMAL